MSTLRKIASFGTAAVVALSLAAAPASAKQPPKGSFDYYAQLDCGSGAMEVGSGSDLWSTFVDADFTCEIASTRPLPPEGYAVACGLDRKVRFGQPPDGCMLTESEKQFLLKAEDYFMARPLADADLPFRLPGAGATPAAFDLSAPWRE